MTDAVDKLVSVVIPVYNGERYLGEAIESALAQFYAPTEVIVVDDGSTDGSHCVAAAYTPRVTLLTHAHAGLGATRNLGIANTRGRYLTFLDADDIWLPDKLSIQVKALQEARDTDMVFGCVEEFFSPDLDTETASRISCRNGVWRGVSAITLCIRREAFMRVGQFETDWRVGEFMDWYAKALEQGLKAEVLPHLLARRRLHKTNMGIRLRDSRADYARVLKASLDRRRQQDTSV